MWSWAQSRGGRIVLLGALGLLLQQVEVPYTTTLFGVTGGASLLHLHAGLLLAIAMLDRDRRVLAGVVAMVFVGWLARAWDAGYDMAAFVPIGAANYAFTWAWALLCAHWMGWPKPHGQARVDKRDLAKFAGVGLLAFPLGLTAFSMLVGLNMDYADRMSSAIQTLFAKHFGIAVLTFPLVMAWCERAAPRPRDFRWQEWFWPMLLGLGVMAGVVVSERMQPDFGAFGERPSVLMDYRFALFALLGWCALRLRPRYSMLLLSLTMFALVHALAGAAGRNGTPPGFANLVHLAFELSVLLIAMLYFLVFERDERELAGRLEAATRRDTATGLPNLAALRYDIELGLLPASGDVGFLVLDHTDDLVAGFGLDMQSRVMNTVAARLAGISRPFLVGMGQFALLPIDAKAGEENWARVIDAVGAIEVDSDGQHFGLSPYLGVANWTDATPAAVEATLLRASQLAFRARRGNEMRPLRDDDATSSQSAAMRQQLQSASDALACLRKQRVELYFQPIRPLDSAHPACQEPEYAVGEVLCRLRGAQGQLLYPDDFLSAIEAVGRNIELDLAVLSTLFALLRKHPRALPRMQRIAINLTGQSLASLGFRRQFEDLLADSPLPLSALCFEITENAVIATESHTRSFLEDLRQRGCRIAIDDFGKGMQSFARLKELPVDIIKIDGAFVRHVAERGRDYALVEASVSIARAFDAETVAEFVETDATANCLRELGVKWMQGYLHAKPQPLDELLATASH